jgi:hypothetical protein
MSGRDVIFIVGMGRSGTSALTRVLSLCGGTLPDVLVAAKEFNEKGSWEPLECWTLNDDFLARHNTMWYDPTMRLEGETRVDMPDRQDYVSKISEFLRTCPKGPLLVIKHPVITEVMEFWFEAAMQEGLAVKVIIAIRHPQEVYASWRHIMCEKPLSVELANARWLKYNLLAERHSRGFPRIVVEYSNLLKDWRSEVTRISRNLCIDLKPDEAAVCDFLTSGLHRQKGPGPIVETFGYPWLGCVYDILTSAAQDHPIVLSALDDVYEAYRASERAFRIAWDEFRQEFERRDRSEFHETMKAQPLLHSGRDF